MGRQVALLVIAQLKSRPLKTAARGEPPPQPSILHLFPLNNSREAKLGRHQAKPIVHPLLPREQAGFRRGK